MAKTIKEAGKPFKVSVSARRYTEWQSRHNSYFMAMGGLYGLAIGADRTRIFSIKVELNADLAYGVEQRLRDALEREGFGRDERRRWDRIWVKTEARKFDCYDKERIEKLATERKATLKTAATRWLQDILESYMEYHGNETYGTIWDTFDVDIPKETLHPEYLAWHKD